MCTMCRCLAPRASHSSTSRNLPNISREGTMLGIAQQEW